MTRTLVGIFWRRIQPAGSSSLIIHLLTWPPSSCRTPPHPSPPPPTCHPGSPPRQGPPCQHVWKKICLKIAEKYYCSEQRILVGLFWRLIQPAGSASLIIHLQTNLTTFFLSNTISSVTSSSSLSPRFTTSAGSSLSTCMKESLKIAEKYYCSEQRKYIIARKALGWASRHPPPTRCWPPPSHITFLSLSLIVSQLVMWSLLITLLNSERSKASHLLQVVFCL